MGDVASFAAPTAHGEIVGYVGGEGERVVALHGGPGLGYDYLTAMVDELRAAFRVASYQQRGIAPSSTEGPFSIDQEVADFVAVLDALGWDRAYVVGHSWGGHLLLHIALAHPDRVIGGVAVDPLGAVGDGGVAAMGEALPSRMAALAETAHESAAHQRAAHAATNLGRVWPAYFAEPARAPEMPPVTFSPESSAGIWASVHEQMPGLADRLGRCEVPIAIVAGERSPIPVAVATSTAAALPHATITIVEGAGHFVWHERPGAVLTATRTLTESLSPRRDASDGTGAVPLTGSGLP